MARVVVIGGGPMGLAAAYRAVLDGHQVDVLEHAPEAGGMAGHFDFGGVSLERFYHFICRPDQPIFSLMQQLGIADKMRWRTTTMGFYFQGRLHPWGNPLALLRLPGVNLLTKFRYGFFAFLCVHRSRWGQSLERSSAREWIIRWCGERAYQVFWRPLMELKFYEYADSIAAPWMWTRMRRLGRSRRNIMQEELGYIEGGSKTIIDALVEAIRAGGGAVHLSNGATRVTVEGGRVTGVDAQSGHFAADAVLSTVPTPLVQGLIPDLPPDWKDRYASIKSIGLCCLIFKLRRPVSPHFWVNISNDEDEVPGIIEFSNLRPLPDSIVYVPYYLPVSNPKFAWTDEQLIDAAFACLSRLNLSLTREDILDVRVARLRHAQPICDVGFAAKLPPVQTPIQGLQVADTCFYYPEDRGMAESFRLGRVMAENISAESTRVSHHEQHR
jgi:protoporphyrinogen oxidase